jgi:hypothetical protein
VPRAKSAEQETTLEAPAAIPAGLGLDAGPLGLPTRSPNWPSGVRTSSLVGSAGFA